jgi:type I restriction-modification system DNA methylase subunit
MEAQISTFVEQLSPLLSAVAESERRRHCLKSLLQFILRDTADLDCPELMPELPAVIAMRSTLDSWNIPAQGDLAGTLYQELSSHHDKKKRGQFFTPDHIVRQILDDALSTHDSGITNLSILDPACGSGQFLIAAYLAARTSCLFRNPPG